MPVTDLNIYHGVSYMTGATGETRHNLGWYSEQVRGVLEIILIDPFGTFTSFDVIATDSACIPQSSFMIVPSVSQARPAGKHEAIGAVRMHRDGSRHTMIRLLFYQCDKHIGSVEACVSVVLFLLLPCTASTPGCSRSSNASGKTHVGFPTTVKVSTEPTAPSYRQADNF